MQELQEDRSSGCHVVSESTGNIYDSNPDYKNVRAEAFLANNKLNWRQSPDIYLNEEPVTVYAYYPYQSQVNFDPENIPVRISPDASLTKDYMYGIQASGQRAVNQFPQSRCLTESYAFAPELPTANDTGSRRLLPTSCDTDRKQSRRYSSLLQG